jgi:hypothetical protein
VILMLLIAGFVTFMVLNATKKSSQVADGDDEGAPGMGKDDTPLGDTTEHAGEQSGDGTTVGGQDADQSGGTGRPWSPARARPPPARARRTRRRGAYRAPRRGRGRHEARLRGPARPASERLADRE